jgi:peptide/nickel transport system substrate-binding protein
MSAIRDRWLTRRRFLGLAGVTASMAWSRTGARAATAVGPKQTFVYAMGADPTNLDPHSTTDGLAVVAMHRCYDKLLELTPGEPKPGTPLDVRPDLAESWRVSDDGLRYTFRLRKGLKFADGSALDAKAVKWSFDRMMAINKGSAAQLRQLRSTEALDATTVQMTLSEPYAYFLPTIAGNTTAAVVNPKIMDHEKDGDRGQAWLANNAMGSGPYVLTEWRRGQQVTLDYNPHWYGQEPAMKRVIVKIVPESTNQKLQLEKGDIDTMAPISIPEMLSLQGKPGVRVLEVPSLLLILAYLNNKKPPLDNVKVRQAMSYAINYDQIIKELIQGKGRRLRGPIAYGMEGYDPSLKGYDYDPAKAKQLLAEAGFPRGVELTLTYASQGAPGADDVALAAQANLAEVGIRVKIEKVAEPTRRERIDKGDFQWSVGGWTTTPLPPQTIYRWIHSSLQGINANRAFYSNPRVDELVSKAPTVLDGAKRIAMYQEAQRLIVDEAPYILFYQANQIMALRDNLDGFEVKPGGSQYMTYERFTKR